MRSSHLGQNPARTAERFPHQDDTRYVLPMFSAHGSRHFGFRRSRSRKFLGCRLSRYSNSTSTFQLNLLLTSWNIHLSPGPSITKPCCPGCSRTIARNHRTVDCNSCGGIFHIKCGKVTPTQFKQMKKSDPINWSCPVCIDKPIMQGDVNSEYLSALPFASVANLSTLVEDGFEGLETSGHCDQDSSGDYLTDLMKRLQAGTSKDVRVAHLNVCSLRSNIEELRCLQLLCRFEILAVTETHRDKSVPDSAVNIPGMKFIRLDSKGRKGGGCILYYADQLQAFHRKDLFTSGIEAAWLQVNFPSASV